MILGWRVTFELIDGGVVSYEYDGLEIEISLGKLYDKQDTIRVAIEYIAKPYEREVGGNEAIEEDRKVITAKGCAWPSDNGK